MFEKIEEVPAQIAEFYQTETRSEQLFTEDGSPVMQEVEYTYTDEEGNEAQGTRMEPVFVNVDYVVPKQRGEFKTISDVWRIVRKHRGHRDDLVKRFLAMVCCANQWRYHDEYLDWYQRGLELEAVVLPEPVEGEPDPLIAHQERIAAHEAQEPVKPALIDVDQWFLDNAQGLREAAYPPKEKQLQLQYNDLRNGTNTWFDAIESVDVQYPTAKEVQL